MPKNENVYNSATAQRNRIFGKKFGLIFCFINHQIRRSVVTKLQKSKYRCKKLISLTLSSKPHYTYEFAPNTIFKLI